MGKYRKKPVIEEETNAKNQGNAKTQVLGEYESPQNQGNQKRKSGEKGEVI